MIVITGASGNTGSKAAELLLAKKIPVRAIGSANDRLKRLSEKGAEIMSGDHADPGFLTKAFQGAKVVYLLVPSSTNSDNSKSYYNAMGNIAISALKKAKIRKVVFLSSLEWEMGSWIGPLHGPHLVERKLDTLRKVDVMVLRAGLFMESMFKYMRIIKDLRGDGNGRPAGEPVQIITAGEIGEKVASLLENPVFKGHSVLNLLGQKWFFYPRLSLNVNQTQPDLHRLAYA
jgi:uncharacterized protein YbjT (DUF2867 family)